jgi:hypothetical protein
VRARRDYARVLVPICGLALLAVLFVQLGPARILWLFQAIGWNMAIIVAIYASHECVRALAVSRCLPADHRPPLRRLLWIRFMGESVRSLTHTGPFLAEPARAWMLARQGVGGAHAYAASVSEFIANTTMSSLVTVVVLGVVLRTMTLSRPLTVFAQVLVGISLGYVVVVAIALATRTYLIGAIVARAGRLPRIGHRLRVDPVQVRAMEDAILRVLRDNPSTTVQVVLLEVVAQIILVIELYWSIRSMGVSITLGGAAMVEALTKLANVIQFVGATEGGYVLVFTWLGMSGAVGFTLSLVKRVRGLAVAALGLGTLALLRRSSSSSAEAARDPAPSPPTPPPSPPSPSP